MSNRRCPILAAWGILALCLVFLVLTPGTWASPAQNSLRRTVPEERVLTVCPSGECNYTTIQEAVDAANDGDTILVAAGTYTDLSVRPRADIASTGVVTQIVYISKTVTIQGGYTTADWATSAPEANPTTLDAQGQGRVLYVTGDITVTIDGFRIIGGDGEGLGGAEYLAYSTMVPEDSGGGVYVITATAYIENCDVFSNTADSAYSGHACDNPKCNPGIFGGGLSLRNCDVTVSGSSITSNTAQMGGGVYAYYGQATLLNSIVSGNVGHGLCFLHSSVHLSGNTIDGNSALFGLYTRGGGVLLDTCDATLVDNSISGNVARGYFGACGGGLSLEYCDASLHGNSVHGNDGGNGGGLCLHGGTVALIDNTVISNTASWLHGIDDGYGGGLWLGSCDARLVGNVVRANSADGPNDAPASDYRGSGGGLFLSGGDLTLRSNVVADNWAKRAGSGLYVSIASADLLHNTIASNQGGDGCALLATYDSTVALTNTVFVSHAVAISVASGCTVTLDSTLWQSNSAISAGAGLIFFQRNDHVGDPAFLDPAAGDYHIGPTSAALDRGITTGVMVDLDHQPRAYRAPDLGADEYWPPGTLKQIRLPLILRP